MKLENKILLFLSSPGPAFSLDGCNIVTGFFINTFIRGASHAIVELFGLEIINVQF